jgi:hypothetical protein
MDITQKPLTFLATHLKIHPMKEWNFTSSDPGSYILAADARTGPTDYTNDHIWELHLDGGEPPGVALRTTFGLRARSLRLLPRFIEGDNAITDPYQFYTAPTLRKVYPNYVEVLCSPFEGIDVKIEYWIPDSHIATGRIQIQNNRLSPRDIEVEWTALLSPTGDGQRMAAVEMEAATVLCGQTDGIYPIVFMTGGPDSGSGLYPALSIEMELAAGASRQLRWAQVALTSQEESFDLARRTVTRAWDSEISRLDVINSGLIEIESGNPQWDAAFALAQKNALGFLIGPSGHLPNPSFVINRHPDQGYSPVGDGSDYGLLWNGQTPLEADFLSTLLLPSSPDIVKGILLNFFDTQTKQGFIDFKPGLGGQRANYLATPILTNLSWRIYQVTEDRSFLEDIFPKLLAFVQSWFTSQQDRDGDGLPEWTRASQSGFDDHPTFAQWQSWAQGGDITKIESPSLCSFLYNEIQLMLKIAEIIEEVGPVPALEALAENLKTAVEAAWNDNSKFYKNWDRETHFSPDGELLSENSGPSEIHIDREFDQPVRLLLRVTAADEIPHDISIFIHGIGPAGNHRVERITDDHFIWNMNIGNVSTERCYKTIEYIQISCVNDDDKFTLLVMDYSRLDHTLFLPLWAQIPSQEKAFEFIKETITNSSVLWQPYGISACTLEPDQDDHPCVNVHMVWNQLIGEGLVAYGYQNEAVELLANLMNAVTQNLVKSKAFYRNYHAVEGHGIGERHSLSGLAPLGLFMEILGVRIISHNKIFLRGINPFPWSVTIKFRGLTVLREAKLTTVTFPGGQTTYVKTADPKIITIKAS